MAATLRICVNHRNNTNNRGKKKAFSNLSLHRVNTQHPATQCCRLQRWLMLTPSPNIPMGTPSKKKQKTLLSSSQFPQHWRSHLNKQKKRYQAIFIPSELLQEAARGFVCFFGGSWRHKQRVEGRRANSSHWFGRVVGMGGWGGGGKGVAMLPSRMAFLNPSTGSSTRRQEGY